MEGKREILNLKKERKEKYLDTFVRKVKYCKISLGPSGNRSRDGSGFIATQIVRERLFQQENFHNNRHKRTKRPVFNTLFSIRYSIFPIPFLPPFLQLIVSI